MELASIWAKVVPGIMVLLLLRSVIIFAKTARLMVSFTNGALQSGKHFEDELLNAEHPGLRLIRWLNMAFWALLVLFCIHVAFLFAEDAGAVLLDSFAMTVVVFSLMSLFLIPVVYFITVQALENYVVDLLECSLAGAFGPLKTLGFVLFWTPPFLLLIGFMAISSLGFADGVAYMSQGLIFGFAVGFAVLVSLIGVLTGFLPGATPGPVARDSGSRSGGKDFFQLSCLQLDILPLYFLCAMYLFAFDHDATKYGEDLFFVALLFTYVLITGCRALLTSNCTAFIWHRFAPELGPMGADVFVKVRFQGAGVVLFGLVRLLLAALLLARFHATWGWSLAV